MSMIDEFRITVDFEGAVYVDVLSLVIIINMQAQLLNVPVPCVMYHRRGCFVDDRYLGMHPLP